MDGEYGGRIAAIAESHHRAQIWAAHTARERVRQAFAEEFDPLDGETPTADMDEFTRFVVEFSLDELD